MLKKKIKLIFIIPLLLITIFNTNIKAQSNYNVLFISSYSLSWESTIEQIKGVRDKLEKKCNIDYLFMNTKVLEYDDAKKLTDDQLKYIDLNTIDCIITGDDDALQYALDYQDSIFKDIPIVFEGVNSTTLAKTAANTNNVTGVSETFPIEETINLAKKINPNADHIVAIYDSTVSGLGSYDQFIEAMKNVDMNFNGINTSEFTPNDLKKKFAQINNKDIVLFLLFSEDLNGNNYTMSQSVNFMTSNISQPIYKADEVGVSYGLLGGRGVNFSKMGEQASDMVLSILHGKNPNDILMEKSNVFTYLNYETLEKFKISEQFFPANTYVFNKPDDIFETYGYIIIPLMLLLALLGLIIVGLIFYQKERRHYIDELKKSQKELEDNLLYDKSSGLITADAFYTQADKLLDTNLCREYALLYFEIDNYNNLVHLYGEETMNEVFISFTNTLKENNKITLIGKIDNKSFTLLIKKDDLNINKLDKLCNFQYYYDKNYVSFIIPFGVYLIYERLKTIEMLNYARIARLDVGNVSINKYGIFNSKIADKIEFDDTLLKGMNTALKNNDLLPYYYPIYDLNDKKIIGVNSLVRWNHQEFGLIKPNNFLQLFIDHGLILTLDEKILNMVLKDIKKAQENNYELLPTYISIFEGNMINPQFHLFIKQLLDKYELPKGIINLTISSSNYIKYQHVYDNNINKLKEYGVNVVIDDYEYNYQNLLSVRDMACKGFKINANYYYNQDKYNESVNILKYIYLTLKSMNKIIIVEDINSQEILDVVTSIGFQYGIGNYFTVNNKEGSNKYSEISKRKLQ